MPPFDAPRDNLGGPTVHQVIDKIQCEIAEARDDPANNNSRLNEFLAKNLKIAPFGEWVASATVSLTINDTIGLTPTAGAALTYIDPLRVPGTMFTFGGSPMFYQQRSRIFTQTYTIEIAKIPPNQTCDNIQKRWNRFNLEGDLGLKDQIYMGLHAFGLDTAADFGVEGTVPSLISNNPDNFGATVSFDVFKGITNLGPTWTLVRFQGPVGGAGYQRDDLNKIAITFVPIKFVAIVKASNGRSVIKRGSISDAAERAAFANRDLVTTQSIQQLGQILSSKPR